TRSKRDWSSDVCSSDLNGNEQDSEESDSASAAELSEMEQVELKKQQTLVEYLQATLGFAKRIQGSIPVIAQLLQSKVCIFLAFRSEERRVGNECSFWLS